MKHAQTPPTFGPLCRLLGHPPVRLDPDVRSATPGSLAVARSEIEASHRHRPVDRQLPRDNAVNCIFAVQCYPMVMHDPVDFDHDLGHGAGHRPTHNTATYVGLVDLAWLVSIARGGRAPCHR